MRQLAKLICILLILPLPIKYAIAWSTPQRLEQVTLNLKWNYIGQEDLRHMSNGEAVTRILRGNNLVLATAKSSANLTLTHVGSGCYLDLPGGVQEIAEITNPERGEIETRKQFSESGQPLYFGNWPPKAWIADVDFSNFPKDPKKGDAAVTSRFNTASWAMPFRPSNSGFMGKLALMLRVEGKAGEYTLSLDKASPDGKPMLPPLYSEAFKTDDLTQEFNLKEFVFKSPVWIEKDSQYAVVVTENAITDGFLAWRGLDKEYPLENWYSMDQKRWTPYPRDLYLKIYLAQIATARDGAKTQESYQSVRAIYALKMENGNLRLSGGSSDLKGTKEIYTALLSIPVNIQDWQFPRIEFPETRGSAGSYILLETPDQESQEVWSIAESEKDIFIPVVRKTAKGWEVKSSKQEAGWMVLQGFDAAGAISESLRRFPENRSNMVSFNAMSSQSWETIKLGLPKGDLKVAVVMSRSSGATELQDQVKLIGYRYRP